VRKVSANPILHVSLDADVLLVEFATVGKTKDGKVYHHLWSGDEIMALLKEHGLAKEEEQETE
jgi:hypothetical protein